MTTLNERWKLLPQSKLSRDPGNSISWAIRQTRLDDLDMVLLDSLNGPVTVTSDGVIELSRHVVSVEENGELRISMDVWLGDGEAGFTGEVAFAPRRSGKSKGICDIEFCIMGVTVAWSLVER